MADVRPHPEATFNRWNRAAVGLALENASNWMTYGARNRRNAAINRVLDRDQKPVAVHVDLIGQVACLHEKGTR